MRFKCEWFSRMDKLNIWYMYLLPICSMCKYTNFGAFIQYLAECKVTSQVPVTTTGRKINITQLIAEKWTPVHKTFTIHWHYINNTFTKHWLYINKTFTKIDYQNCRAMILHVTSDMQYYCSTPLTRNFYTFFMWNQFHEFFPRQLALILPIDQVKLLDF